MEKREKKVPVMEIFGPTIQGEGMVVGRKTMFVRTGGCDYKCAWCDSAFTWDGSQQATLKTGQQIWDEMVELGSHENGELNFNHITISGGNPALFKEPIANLISIAHQNNVQVGLETQGSLWKEWFYEVDDLTISPKPPSSGMETDWDKLDDIIFKLDAEEVNYTLKVVIFDDADYDYAVKVYQRYEPEVFYVSVGNEDATSEGSISGRLLSKLEWLWSKVIEDPRANNWRPLPQLHTLVWDNKRGV